MAREYFPAYHSYLESMSELTDAERGRLFAACLIYSKTGKAPQLSGNERFVFPSFKAQIDRDNKTYQDLCNRNRKNGSMSRKANGTECPRTPPNGTDRGAVAPDRGAVGTDRGAVAPQGEEKGKGEEEIKEKTPAESKRKVFSVPSLEEVREYCRNRKSPVNPEAFWDYYASKGWTVGRAPMKDWKAAVRNWERNERPRAPEEKEDPYANVIA